MMRFLLINIIIVLLFTSCKLTNDEITDNNITDTTGEAIDVNNKEPNDIIDEQSDVEAESIKDESKSYEDDLDYLINYPKEIIKNLSHETYKPNENVTYGEFIAYVLRAIRYDFKEEENKDWTAPYIEEAIMYSFIRQGEIEDYTKPINRGDVAKIVSRTDKRISELYLFRPSKEIEKLINDYNVIDEKYKIYVVKAIDLGIMECNNGNFEPEKLLTKEKCVTIIRRMIDTSARKVPQLEEEVSTEVTDKEIEEQLQYIEDNVYIGMSIDDLEKKFISNYRNLSFEDDMLDYHSSSPIRKISMYIYDGKSGYSNFEKGYTFFNDNNIEIGTITSIEDRYLLIDNGIKVTYFNVYTDLRVFVNNLLKTRKAGLKVDIYSDYDYEVIGIAIFYVTGENNNINLIKYNSDGSKEVFKNIEENIIDYINIY